MPLIQFVQNYDDLSTDKGHQLKFFCDECHSGFMTRFQTSTIGMAESALKVAGSFFGGIFNTVGNSAYEIQRAVGGPAGCGAAVQPNTRFCASCGHKLA